LLEHWGVRRDFLLGHSIGEVPAAHAAGVLPLDDAGTLVAARARLMQALPRTGAMVRLRAAESDVVPLLTDKVDIAAVNGPSSVVISGDEDAVLEIAARFDAQRLPVSHAFHSHHVNAMLDEFRRAVQALAFRPAQIPIVATGDVGTPEYWVRQVRDTVRFGDGMRRLETDGVSTYITVGP